MAYRDQIKQARVNADQALELLKDERSWAQSPDQLILTACFSALCLELRALALALESAG